MLHLTTQNFDICRMNHWQFSSDTPAKAGPEHPTLAVVMFYAVWCGKCAMMRPVIEDLEKKYQTLTVVGCTDNRGKREPHWKVIAK